MTSIQTHVVEIKNRVFDMKDLLSKGLEYTVEIARNTSYCKKLDRIDRTLDEIHRNGIKVK